MKLPHRLATLLLIAVAALPELSAAESARVVHSLQFANVIDAAAWKQWSPRQEIAPKFAFDLKGGRDGRVALKIAANASSDSGACRSTLGHLRAGQIYRFNAWYRTKDVDDVRRSVISRLEWLDATGKPVRFTIRPPEYPSEVSREADWAKMELVVRAPETAVALDVQLSLGFDADGVVWWDTVSLTEVDSAPDRVVRAMTVHLRPRNSPSREASVAQFCAAVRQAADQKPDIVCLPEGITVVGTKLS